MDKWKGYCHLLESQTLVSFFFFFSLSIASTSLGRKDLGSFLLWTSDTKFRSGGATISITLLQCDAVVLAEMTLLAFSAPEPAQLLCASVKVFPATIRCSAALSTAKYKFFHFERYKAKKRGGGVQCLCLQMTRHKYLLRAKE